MRRYQPKWKGIMSKITVRSSKELYYSICSALMGNGITNGIIFSRSREILDGISDYMSAVRIPWCYKFSDYKGIGYCLSEEEIKSDHPVISINYKGNGYVEFICPGKKAEYDLSSYRMDDIGKNEPMDMENPIHLKNEQIRKMFLKAFAVAEKEIDIISPWMNFSVVNEGFVQLMRKAFERGVTIKIKYGLKPNSSEFDVLRSTRSDQVAEYLRDTFMDFSGQLAIVRDNIHYKLVLCDEKFKLEGGFNYLSFIGDYSNEDTRKEGSPYGTDVKEIRYLRKEYFGGDA